MSKLLTPGPVHVPEFVMEAIRRPVIHHRSQGFAKFYGGMLERLGYLFQARQVGTMIGSGTYGVASMMYSVFRPGEKVLVLSNGKFSGRWKDEALHLGLEVRSFEVAWGKAIQTNAVMKDLENVEALAGVVITHSETSTSCLVDLEELAFQLRQKFPEVLILVDGITSVGAMPYYHDTWAIDASITASQKSLMNPAGTVAFALSDRALGRLRPTHQGDFRNVWNYMEAIKKLTYPYTAPVQLLYGLDAALQFIEEAGLPAVWDRCHQSARYFRKSLLELGGETFGENISDSLTAFSFPEKAAEQLKVELKSRFAWTLSSGQGGLKGVILRTSHMGTSDVGVMEEFVRDLRACL